jgi:hypothetical protein
MVLTMVTPLAETQDYPQQHHHRHHRHLCRPFRTDDCRVGDSILSLCHLLYTGKSRTDL